MTSIYDQHDKAFKNVSAFCITDSKGRKVGTVTIKHGESRLTAYFHLLGMGMVKGAASGYGYSKACAAMAEAVSKLEPETPEQEKLVRKFKPLLDDGGWYWFDKVEGIKGLHCLQVI